MVGFTLQPSISLSLNHNYKHVKVHFANSVTTSVKFLFLLPHKLRPIKSLVYERLMYQLTA